MMINAPPGRSANHTPTLATANGMAHQLPAGGHPNGCIQPGLAPKPGRARMNDPSAEEVIEPVEAFVNSTLREQLRSTLYSIHHLEQQQND